MSILFLNVGHHLKIHGIMITEKEKSFMQYWEANRLREQQLTRQFLLGLPVGLLASIPVILVLFSGKYWYKRAEAVANTKLSPAVLLVAVFLIATFVAVFYRRYRWEQQEQFYKVLKAKASKTKNIGSDAAKKADPGS